MPRVWLWVRGHLYVELERMAKEKGVGVDDLILKLIEDYVKGRLVPSEHGARLNGEVRELKRRLERLEEEVMELKATLKLMLKRTVEG